MREFVKEHRVVLIMALIGAISFALYTWAEYGYFCDQASEHDSACDSFWSETHMHDYIYNIFSNWQSEAIVGVVLVLLIKQGRKAD